MAIFKFEYLGLRYIFMFTEQSEHVSNNQILTLLQDLCSIRNIVMDGQSRSTKIAYDVLLKNVAETILVRKYLSLTIKPLFLMKRK